MKDKGRLHKLYKTDKEDRKRRQRENQKNITKQQQQKPLETVFILIERTNIQEKEKAKTGRKGKKSPRKAMSLLLLLDKGSR